MEVEGDICRSVGEIESVELCKGRICEYALWDGVKVEGEGR